MGINIDFYIKKYNLQPHPEGGYYGHEHRDNRKVQSTALNPNTNEVVTRDFDASSTIVFALDKNSPMSALHDLSFEETWIAITGSTEIHIFHNDGTHEKKLVGLPSDNIEAEPFAVMPANTLFAAKLPEGVEFSVACCVVTPGFEFELFHLAKPSALINYPSHTQEIMKTFISPKFVMPTIPHHLSQFQPALSDGNDKKKEEKLKRLFEK